MEPDLFTKTDVGQNIQKFEDELRKLLDAFQTANNAKVSSILIDYGWRNHGDGKATPETKVFINITKR
jgi:hypothetical protein